MRLPSLTVLQMFECAARYSSFSRAAAEMHVTESAVSRQIQALEERLGVRFFERVKKRVILTPDGARYAREIRGELKAIERATKNLASRADGVAAIDLAVVPTFATQWLIPRLADFHTKEPRILVNVFARPDPFQFAESAFDAVIYFGEKPWEGLPATKLLTEGPSVPVCNPSLVQAAGMGSRNDLLKLPRLHLASRPDAWPDWFAMDDEPVRRQARSGARYDLFTMLTRAACCGLGVALLPELMVQSELESGQLTRLPFEQVSSSDTNGAYFLSFRQSGSSRDKLQVFAEWLFKQCDQSGGETQVSRSVAT